MKEYIVPDDFLNAETIASAEGQGYLHEIVRCKDCKHFRNEVKDEFTTYIGCSEKHGTWGENWYCADGEWR